jgi:hypothetical protein
MLVFWKEKEEGLSDGVARTPPGFPSLEESGWRLAHMGESAEVLLPPQRLGHCPVLLTHTSAAAFPAMLTLCLLESRTQLRYSNWRPDCLAGLLHSGLWGPWAFSKMKKTPCTVKRNWEYKCYHAKLKNEQLGRQKCWRQMWRQQEQVWLFSALL